MRRARRAMGHQPFPLSGLAGQESPGQIGAGCGLTWSTVELAMDLKAKVVSDG